MKTQSLFSRRTNADIAYTLIRLLVGIIFLSEGLQKFIYPEALGPGRFAGMGFPAFTFWAYFVAVIEIVCGAMVIVGFYTRIAAAFLWIDISVALIVTKLPILFGTGFGPFEVRQLSRYGFWAFMHAFRTDISMFIGTIFLLIEGGGKWSWDLKLNKTGGKMAPVSIRYIVDDVNEAINFYTKQLGFDVHMHPAPTFAILNRGDLRLLLSAPSEQGGGGQSMPDDTQPKPGGWNRFHLEVEDLDAMVNQLKKQGAHFRNEIVEGVAGRQILLEDSAGNPIELFEYYEQES